MAWPAHVQVHDTKLKHTETVSKKSRNPTLSKRDFHCWEKHLCKTEKEGEERNEQRYNWENDDPTQNSARFFAVVQQHKSLTSSGATGRTSVLSRTSISSPSAWAATAGDEFTIAPLPLSIQSKYNYLLSYSSAMMSFTYIHILTTQNFMQS